MALRVEAEMIFPTGGAVVSRSGVAPLWDDPGEHVTVELPGGNRADAPVL